MSQVQKFLFDTSFDAPPPAVEPEVVSVAEDLPPPPPPPPTFSEAELAAAVASARLAGVAEGLKQGRDEALQGQGQVANQLLDSINVALGALLKEQAARLAQHHDNSLNIALTIARKLLPDYVARHSLAEIEALALKVLAELHDEPRLVIRVADAMLDPVTMRLTALAEQQGHTAKLVFLADATLAPADCRIEWADGGAERDIARLWGDIDRAVANALRSGGPSAPRTPPEGQATTSIES